MYRFICHSYLHNYNGIDKNLPLLQIRIYSFFTYVHLCTGEQDRGGVCMPDGSLTVEKVQNQRKNNVNYHRFVIRLGGVTEGAGVAA